MNRIRIDGLIIKEGVIEMTHDYRQETLVERKVTYILELEGRFVIIKNVPARVNVETGEQYFSPEVVEQIQQTIWEEKKPDRLVETPVFEFAA
jgi:YgiT-type zinc finger domain-containing protein